MCLLQNTPILLKHIYILTGIFQLTLKKWPFLWYLPCYTFYGYLFYLYYHTPNDYNPTFVILDVYATTQNVAFVTICVISFHRRSHSLNDVLTQLDTIEAKLTFGRKYDPDWCPRILPALLVSFFFYVPFMNSPAIMLFFPVFPLVLNCFDILFLNDVLAKFLHSFKAINDNIKTMNVQLIQDLSSTHFTLVTLASKICKNFEVTLIAAFLLWFDMAVETVYYVVVLIAHGGRDGLDYACNVTWVIYYFVWLFVVVKIFARVEAEANQTSEFVHDVWEKYIQKGLTDKKICHLQLVSVGFLNNKLRFTVRGIFDLNWTFCHTVGTVFSW